MQVQQKAAETQIVKWKESGKVDGDPDTLSLLYLSIKAA